MTNEELISKYYDGNMQALYDLYEQNVGFIHSVAAAVAKDYKNYLRFSDTFEDLVQVGCLTFFEKLKAKNMTQQGQSADISYSPTSICNAGVY